MTTATAKVHSADENQVGANNGGGIYRWPEFDSRAGVSRLQPYPRLAHASYSLRKATKPKNPVPLEPSLHPRDERSSQLEFGWSRPHGANRRCHSVE